MALDYVVGIDLGTTNTVMACAKLDTAGNMDPGEAVELIQVPQFLAPGEVAPLQALPSALYLPSPHELAPETVTLPWEKVAGDSMPAPLALVGEVAKRLGSKTPGRLITSAKSWLCHPGVDRESPLLPWGAPDDVPRMSPLEASTRILLHLKHVWDQAHPGSPLAEQEVVLTVPASFDEVARELTVQAAAAAGLTRLNLLEEPQAAFHDFVASQKGALAQAVKDVRLVLVVDVGGGTTDLTLVQVISAKNGDVELKRIAVGDHILLGGDNMDLALARLAEQKAGLAGKLDPAQWSQLVFVSRMAKQALLSDKGGPPKYGMSIAGRGSKLVGGSIKVELGREEALAVLLDGFFPVGPVASHTPKNRGGGLMELGLPYAQEVAIPRHLSAFLWRHAAAAREALQVPGDTKHLPRPDAVLLNGGVFRAAAIRDRLQDVFKAWWPEQGGVPYLAYSSLDSAVAKGAAYHGLTRRGLGHRITGGIARAYYVGLGDNKALCVVPRGHDGVEELVVPRQFALTVGKPARFPVMASSARQDKLGDVVDLADADQFEMLPPIQTVLEGAGGEVPVKLHAQVTEIGTLELSCVGEQRRWKLEFQLRASTVPLDERRVEGSLPPTQKGLPEAKDWVDRVYGRRPQPVEMRDVKALGKHLAGILGERETWNTATLRELHGAFMAGADRRRRSDDHERVWFQHAGYCLRPGFGAPLDSFRVNELWGIFEQGVQYVGETPNWTEWWVLWRRVSGGLSRAQQERILETVTPWLKPHMGRGAPPRPKGPKALGREEMVRLVVSLERLTAEQKSEVGRWLMHDLEDKDAGRKSWWPVGRLGARVPFYGSAGDVVKREKVELWLEKLLARDWKNLDGAAFAAAMMARRTGDRERDVAETLRETVASRLEKVPGSERWVVLVREGGAALQVEDQNRMLGESLPPGLRLLDAVDA